MLKTDYLNLSLDIYYFTIMSSSNFELGTNNRRSRVTIVELEGNIGAGKSTILDYVAQKGLPVYSEPILQWIDLIDLFYSDPKKYSFALQVQIINDIKSRYVNIIETYCNSHQYRSNIVYCERGLIGQSVFIDLAKKSGYLNDDECAYLERRIAEINKMLKQAPVTIKRFYVKVDPNVCLKRIRIRGRKCEQDIPLDYLVGIANGHDRFQFDQILDGNDSELEMNYDNDGNVTFENKVAFRVYKTSLLDQIPRGIYYVDGNVGSGKSTFIESLGKLTDHNVKGVAEELDDKIVASYYQSPSERAVEFERHVTNRTVNKVRRAFTTFNYDNLIFVERSPIIDDAFSRIRQKMAYLTEAETSSIIGDRNLKLCDDRCRVPFLLNINYVLLNYPVSGCVERVFIRDGRSLPEKFFTMVESESLKSFQSLGIRPISIKLSETDSKTVSRDKILAELYHILT